MNSSIHTPDHPTPSIEPRAPVSTLAYGACSALMPYALAALLLIAFG